MSVLASTAKSDSEAPLKRADAKFVNLADKEFIENKYRYYAHWREHRPVVDAKIAVVKLHAVARYEDCMALLKDDRFGRDRAAITGGKAFPFPVPKSISLLSQSMIVEDDPEHRRLRNLVQKAFSPKRLASVEGRVAELAHQLIDAMQRKSVVDLQQEYALQIPSIVIAEMVGLSEADMPKLQHSLHVLSDGLSGWNILRTVFWDLKKATAFMRELVEKKRRNPGNDILSGLIEAEEEGERLSEDELIAMLFLLIIAGYETTVHLITNGVVTLLKHPQQLQLLRNQPDLIGSAVEEILRFLPPVQGTKMNYAKQDLEFAGTVFKRGDAIVPLLGSANRDSRIFEDPDTFNIQRANNKHLSFSQGNHFCLGAFLARMEAKLALSILLERMPNISAAKPLEELPLQRLPLWHRYAGLPIHMN